MDDLAHVIEFSQDNKLLALVDESGKLKIWDTETNKLRQEYVPNLHLASPITCLKWIEVNLSSATPKQKKKKQEPTKYLALGTNTGKVLLYSYAKGAIERTLSGQGHNDSVNDLYYDGGDFIYTCSSDSKVIKWSLNENRDVEKISIGKDKPTALTVTHKYIVTASNQIKVWDLNTKKLIRTLIGHSSEVTSLKTFINENKTYCISVSKSDRGLSLWCLENNSKEAVTSFITNESVFSTSFKLNENVLYLTAVNRIGMLHYFILNLYKINPTKPVKRKTNLQIASTFDKGQPEALPIVAAYLESDGKMLVGYGDRFLLHFELINLDTNIKENVLIRKNPKKPTNLEKDAIEQNVIVPNVDKNQVEYLNQVSAVKRTRKTIETPLETRLENISEQTSLPQPKNMVRLLIQGLHSKDAAILRTVFQTIDDETVRTTLFKLPPQYVQPLIQELSQLMMQRSMHVKSAIVWMKFLLQIHTSQLLLTGNEALEDSLSMCLGVMDNRIETLPTLSLLHGRLNLLTTQLKRSDNKDAEDEIVDKDLLTYQDDSDDDLNGIEDQPIDEDADDFLNESDSGSENEMSDVKEEMDVSD